MKTISVLHNVHFTTEYNNFTIFFTIILKKIFIYTRHTYIGFYLKKYERQMNF